MAVSSLEDFKSKRFWTGVFAEFLGTALLVLVGCGSCLAPDSDDGHAKVLKISLCFGLSVASIVWAICNVSGGHINPAVTIGFLVVRQISFVRFLLYIIFQSLGAIAGAAVLKAVTPANITGTLGTSDTGVNASTGQVFGVELLISFVFVFAVMASCDKQRSDLGGSIPLAVGLTIAMCHLWAVPISGSGMNPARVFGPALVARHWNNHWVYWIAPLIGGAIGGFLYDFVFAVNATSAKVRGCFTRNYDNDNYDNSGRMIAVHGAENDAEVQLTEKQ